MLISVPINRLWEWFDNVDENQSGQINVTELRQCYSSFIRDLVIPLMLLSGKALINGDLTRAYLLMSIFQMPRTADNIPSIAFDLNTVNLLMNLFVRVIS